MGGAKVETVKTIIDNQNYNLSEMIGKFLVTGIQSPAVLKPFWFEIKDYSTFSVTIIIGKKIVYLRKILFSS